MGRGYLASMGIYAFSRDVLEQSLAIPSWSTSAGT